ncbi:hypothetical protein ACQSSU_06785 [Micromonospora echinospora]
MTVATCAEEDCTALVADLPDNHCGGPDGGPQGCGRLFCGDHLFATKRDGYLCSVDYDNLDHWIDESDAAQGGTR